MNPRWMLLLLSVLWVTVLVSASAAIQMRHESRSLFMHLERLTAERDRLSIEWGRLQLEQSSWSTLGVVEQEASSRLGMAIPVARAVRMVTP
jgi:cell division protein FtsL